MSQRIIHEIVEAVGDCLNIIADGKTVRLGLRSISEGGPGDLPAPFRGPCVSSMGEVRTPSATGRVAFVHQVADALIYVGLMLGLDGGRIQARLAEGFGAEDADAFGEAMNQSFGRLAAVTTTNFGTEIHAVHLSTRVVDLTTGSVAPIDASLDGRLRFAQLDLSIEGYPASTALLVWPAGLLERRSPEGSSGTYPSAGSGTYMIAQKTNEPRTRDVQRAMKVQLPLTVLLAEIEMSMREVFELTPGSIIEFSKSSEEYLHLLIGEKKFAEGEAAKTGDKFCFQVKRIARPS